MCNINDAIKIARKVMENKNDEFLTYVVGEMLVTRSYEYLNKPKLLSFADLDSRVKSAKLLSFEDLYSRVKSNGVKERLKAIMITCDKEVAKSSSLSTSEREISTSEREKLRKDDEDWHNANFYNDEFISYS